MVPSAKIPGGPAVRRRWRLALRWLVLLAAVVVVWPGRVGAGMSVILPALSPFVAAAAVVAVRAVGLLTLLAVPVLVLGLLFPRWFCRHGCPAGLLQEMVERLRPKRAARWARWPAVGQWLVWVTLGGAVAGYPLFLWLDPLAIFHGFLNAWRQPLAWVALAGGLALPGLLLFDLLAPRLWCQRLCPLGAVQDALAWPRRRLRQAARRRQAEEAVVSRWSGGRRWFLGGVAGMAGAFAARWGRASSVGPLRPPGASEERFTGLCVRCGNCAQACPSKIIHPDWGAGGVAGWLAPMLRFEGDYCREDCHRCHLVCPSGAIPRLSLDKKRRQVIGRAVVELNSCLLAQGRECTACIQKCPFQAIALWSADGFSNEPRVIPDRCNGCGACEVVCPVRPARAIRVASRAGGMAQGLARP